MLQCACGGQRTIFRILFSFCHVGPRDHTQVNGVGRNYLYLPSHLNQRQILCTLAIVCVSIELHYTSYDITRCTNLSNTRNDCPLHAQQKSPALTWSCSRLPLQLSVAVGNGLTCAVQTQISLLSFFYSWLRVNSGSHVLKTVLLFRSKELVLERLS